MANESSSNSSGINYGEAAPVVNSVSSAEVASMVAAAISAGEPQTGIPDTVTNSTVASVTDNAPDNGTGNRIDGYSVTTLPNNTAIVAFSAPDQHIYPIGDSVRSALSSNRIYLAATQLSSKYQTIGVRKGTLIPRDDYYFYLKVDNAVAKAVASTVTKDSKLNSFYFLDGPYAKSERYAEWYEVEGDSLLRFPYYEGEDRLAGREYCVSYVGLNRSDTQVVSDASGMLTGTSALPFITVAGQIVPAMNPQIVARKNASSMDQPYYIYVFAEAPVNGVYQLFMYCMRLSQPSAAIDAQLSSESTPSSNSSSSSSSSKSTQTNSSPSSKSTNSSSSSSNVGQSTSSSGESLSSGSTQSSDSLSSDQFSTNSSSNSSSSQSTKSSNSSSSKSSDTRSSSSSSSSSSQDEVRVVGWVQLTFAGENRNARVTIDSSNTIHLVWQSSRCAAEQLYYGVIGPMSSVLNNESLVSAIGKQAAILSGDIPSVVFDEPIVEASTPTAMDLTQPGGRMWAKSESATNAALIASNTTITISGNPKTTQMIAFTSLDRDEGGTLFGSYWRQLSYQVAFNLTATMSGVTLLADSDIASKYTTFTNQFTLQAGGTNSTYFKKANNIFNVGIPERVSAGFIPVVGSYRLEGLQAALAANSATVASDRLESGTLGLRHFVLGLVPEQVYFRAVNTQTQSEFLADNPAGTYAAEIAESYYTGRFRLTLLIKTTDTPEGYRAVREFGPWLSIGATTNVKIAVHYSHLPTEAIDHLTSRNFAGRWADEIRYQGDIVIMLDNTAVAAESFFADFTDTYQRFDIGVGVPSGGEFTLPVMVPYDGSSYPDQSVTLAFSSIAVGPHSIEFNPAVSHVANLDRHTNTMIVRGTDGPDESSPQCYSVGLLPEDWKVDYGLSSGQVSLTQVPITFSGVNSVASICMDFCDHPHIAWQSNRDGRWEVYYSDAPFDRDTRITAASGNSLSPSVAVDRMGRRLVVWHDDRSGSYQIYAATSLDTTDCEASACRLSRANDAERRLEIAAYSSSSDSNLSHSTSSNSSDYDAHAQTSGSVRFTYTNSLGGTARLHYRLSFYSNDTMSHLVKQVYSRNDISNWQANGVQLEYDGVLLSAGEQASIVYYVSEEDGLGDAVYWVKVESHDGTSYVVQQDRVVYFCQSALRRKCHVPVVYTNSSGSTQNLHFRITFYDSSSMTTAVYSHSSATDPRKWRAFDASYPAPGISVVAGSTVSVAFDPDVLPFEKASQTTGQALLCGVEYYAKVEYTTGGGYTTLNTLVFQCPCEDAGVSSVDARTWISSAYGRSDLLVSAGVENSLFPSARAAWDGHAYIAWEDHRFSGMLATDKKVAPVVMLATYDLASDNLFSSGQHGFDHKISDARRYHPIVTVDSLLNPVVFFNDRYDVYRRALSLSETRTRDFRHDYANLFDDSSVIDIDEECLRIDVYKPDVAGTFYKTPDVPVHTVGKCLVRFEVQCPPYTRGVRLKNESGDFSEWLSILPELPGDRIEGRVLGEPSSSGSEDETLRYRFEAYFIADDRFVVPWVLSAGTGDKTITCELLTAAGRTTSFSTSIIAAYDEFPHRIDFYADEAHTEPLPTFNGTPVASTKRVKVGPLSPTNVNAITSDRDNVASVYFTVTFSDAALMADLMSLSSIRGFSNGGSFTFDVIRKGTADLLDQPLTRPDSTKWVFAGSFPISVSDGVESLDGLAVIRVNVPDPRVETAAIKSDVVKLDDYNSMNSPLGKYAAQYSDRLALDAEDIREVQVARANASIIDADTFREVYRRELACTFLGRSCNDIRQPDDDLSSTSMSSVSSITGSPLSEDSSHPQEPICGSFNWEVPITSEPGFWKYSTSPVVFMRHSDPVYLDLSSKYVVGVRFNAATKNKGVLLLIPDTEYVKQTWSGVPGADVAFDCPAGTIVFGVNPSPAPYITGPTLYNAATSKKTFTLRGTTAPTVTIDQGTVSNDGGGDPSLFNQLGWTKYDDFVGISIEVLKQKGFVTSSGLFHGKFVHIVCGVGFCKVDSFTCDTTFDQTSSSSPSSVSSGPPDSESSELCGENVPLWPYDAEASPRNVCQATEFVLYTMYDISGEVPAQYLPSSSSSQSSNANSSMTSATSVGHSGL